MITFEGVFVGMVIGGAIGTVAYHWGHSVATKWWSSAVAMLKTDKTKLEAELSKLRARPMGLGELLADVATEIKEKV